MKVVQSLNQNAVLVQNELGEELVALGKGIGFKKGRGDEVEPLHIAKLFTVQSSYQQQQLFHLIKQLDDEVLSMAQDITLMAEQTLGKPLVDTFVFTMAKHLQFVLERSAESDGMVYDPFQYQLKYLYPAEYQLALKTLEYIRQHYHLQLATQEVSFMTLHYVNGLIDNEGFHDVVQLSDMLNRMIEFIEQQTSTVLDKNSTEYGRFIVHMRYFLVRTMAPAKQPVHSTKMLPLLEVTKGAFQQEWSLLQAVKQLLQEEFELTFGYDEELYLLLHLIRILGKEES